jgi:hypothetical protein
VHVCAAETADGHAIVGEGMGDFVPIQTKCDPELWSYQRDLRGYLQVNQHARRRSIWKYMAVFFEEMTFSNSPIHFVRNCATASSEAKNLLIKVPAAGIGLFGNR